MRSARKSLACRRAAAVGHTRRDEIIHRFDRTTHRLLEDGALGDEQLVVMHRVRHTLEQRIGATWFANQREHAWPSLIAAIALSMSAKPVMSSRTVSGLASRKRASS